MIKTKIKILLLLIVATFTLFAQNNKITMSGTIKDKRNGEIIVGATLSVNEKIGSNTVVDKYGFYYLFHRTKTMSVTSGR